MLIQRVAHRSDLSELSRFHCSPKGTNRDARTRFCFSASRTRSAAGRVFQRRANDELNVKRYCGLARNKDGDKCTINITRISEFAPLAGGIYIVQESRLLACRRAESRNFRFTADCYPFDAMQTLPRRRQIDREGGVGGGKHL